MLWLIGLYNKADVDGLCMNQLGEWVGGGASIYIVDIHQEYKQSHQLEKKEGKKRKKRNFNLAFIYETFIFIKIDIVLNEK